MWFAIDQSNVSQVVQPSRHQTRQQRIKLQQDEGEVILFNTI